MVREDLKYQIPECIDFYNVMDVSKEFGKIVYDIKDKTYIIGNEFFFIKDAKIYNLYDTYNVIVGENENGICVCLVSNKDIDDIVDAIDSNILDEETFIPITKDLLEDIKKLSVSYLLTLIDETRKFMQDNDFKISHVDMTDSIEDQMSDLKTGVVDSIYSGGCQYTLHNPCPNIYAICREVYATYKSPENKEIRYIEGHKFESLASNLKSGIVENYWDMIGDPMYISMMENANTIVLITNRLNSLKVMLNFNGYNIDGNKMTFWESRKFKKFLKKVRYI